MLQQRTVGMLWTVPLLLVLLSGFAPAVELAGEYILQSYGAERPDYEWEADDPHKDPPLYVWVRPDGTLLLAETDERGPDESLTGTYRADGDDVLVFGLVEGGSARFEVAIEGDVTTLTFAHFIDAAGAPIGAQNVPPSLLRSIHGLRWLRLVAQPHAFTARPPVWMVELAAKDFISDNAERWCGKSDVFWMFTGLEIEVLSVGPYDAAADVWPAVVHVVTDGQCKPIRGNRSAGGRSMRLDKTVQLSYRADTTDPAQPRWEQVEPAVEVAAEAPAAETSGPVSVTCDGILNKACAAELLTRHFGFPATQVHRLVLGEKVSVAREPGGDVEAWVDSDENQNIYRKVGESGYLYGEFNGFPPGWKGVVDYVDLSLTEKGEAALGKLQYGDVQVGVWGKMETVQAYYVPLPMYDLSLKTITGIRLEGTDRATIQYTLEKTAPTHWLTDIPMLEQIHGAPRLTRSVTVAKYTDGWRVEED